MALRGVGFVGIRTGLFQQTVSLFRDVIGANVIRYTDDLAGFELGDGVLEIYDRKEPFHAFFSTGPVVGFKVADFDATHDVMQTAGVKFIGEVQHSAGTNWRHFYCPDGTIGEIIGPGVKPRGQN